MKNIHVLPTNKPSRLQLFKGINEFEFELCSKDSFFKKGVHIYITSDEEIKDGDYYLYLKNNRVYQFVKKHHTKLLALDIQKKIILTTDQELIKDGVQSIDDEFLEWFVKNRNCEFVIVRKIGKTLIYNAEIKKEETKQETLEEAAERILLGEDLDLSDYDKRYIFKAMVNIAKWQQERMYSEKDIINALHSVELKDNKDYSKIYKGMKEWFEQFKNK